MVEYLLDQLMELFSVDLSYFAERVPVISDIETIFIAVGWALLIGNLAYQAMRSMVSGVGIEAEEPARLFLRTAMFSFLLLVSRQICDIGLSLSATVMEMLQVPDAITFDPFGEETFDTLPNAGWLIVIIVNVVIQWQLIKLFLEVAERYVILCVLTYCAPLAFAMGGSKSTSEIFRGWLRMFASMCALMVFNLLFVKLVLSALSTDPNGAAIIPWAMLVVGIVRMAKKMDGIILRIGMNPALTGDPIGARFPGALTAMTLRSIASIVTRTAAQHTPFAGHGNTTGMPPHGRPFGNTARNTGFTAGRQNTASGHGAAAQHAAGGHASIDPTAANANMAGAMAAFRDRYGADNAANMRQVRQAVSIDADDFIEESTTGGSVTQNSTITHAVTNPRVTPVLPPPSSLPADFGRIDAPEAANGHPPVTPTRLPNETGSHMVSPVSQQHMPRSPEQVLQHKPGTEAGAAPAPARQDAAPTGRIPAVVPPVSPQAQESSLRDDHTGSTARTGHAPVQPPVPANAAGSVTHTDEKPPAHSRVTPLPETNSLRPARPSAAAASQPPQAVPNAVAAAASAAAVGSIIAQRTPEPPAPASRTAPARDSLPPQAVRPAVGGAVTPAKQQAPAMPAQAAARVTPVPANTGAAPERKRHAPVQQAEGPVHSNPRTANASAERLSRPAISPARREHNPARRNADNRLDVTPGVRTPDMVTPPPAGQPRTLRRSAQPLKNKVAPEAPKRGGNRHRKRKRKK